MAVKKITPNVANKLASGLVGHTVDLMRFSESVRERIIPMLEKLQKDITGKLISLESSSVLSNRAKAQKLQDLFASTERTLRTGYRDLRDAHLEELVPLAKLEGKYMPQLFTNVIETAGLIEPAFTAEQLKVLAKKSLVRGAPSEEWWGRQATSLRQSFEDQVRMGYMQGETTNDLVQRIRGTTTGKRGEFQGGIMDVSTRNAEALVRTSVQAVANDIQMATYENNDDLIQGLQALATLDARTTLLCRSRDGRAWNMDTFEPIDPNDEAWPGRPPWHWNCRTVLVPLTYSWEQLSQGNKKQKALARKVDRSAGDSMRASMDGQIADRITQDEWLKSRPVAEQKDILGPARWDLWTNEGITFEQMIDQRGNSLTVKQIESRM